MMGKLNTREWWTDGGCIVDSGRYTCWEVWRVGSGSLQHRCGCQAPRRLVRGVESKVQWKRCMVTENVNAGWRAEFELTSRSDSLITLRGAIGSSTPVAASVRSKVNAFVCNIPYVQNFLQGSPLKLLLPSCMMRHGSSVLCWSGARTTSKCGRSQRLWVLAT